MLLVVLLVAGFVNTDGALLVPKEKYNKTLQVRTKKGTIQGIEEMTNNGVSYFSFKGIPFAQPPVGNLRFRSPVPNKKWKGVLNGSRYVPGCIELQVRITGMNVYGQEDCLYLNIFTPQIPKVGKNLSVMVWIYGGAFMEGNSSLFGSHYFMEKGVIFVTMNYRLGILGFLTTEDKASPGNYGLKDQLAALKWLNVNIKYFGGNPNKITIFGISSGACCVMHHVVAEKSRGLFSGALVISGETLSPWTNQRYPLNIADDIGVALQISTNNTTNFINRLRRVDSDILIEVQKNIVLAHLGSFYHEGLPFTPTIEPKHKDAFITEPTYNRLKRGDIAKVPIIFGRTSLEFATVAQVLPVLRILCLLLDISPSYLVTRFSIPDSQRYRVGELIKKQYFPLNSPTSASTQEIFQFLTDIFFFVPMERTLRLLSQHTTVYSYIFSYDGQISRDFLEQYLKFKPSRSLKGVGHASDAIFLFNNNIFKFTNSRDILTKERIMTLWTNFAKFRNPTPQRESLLQNVIWQPITNYTIGNHLDIGNDLKMIKRHGRESYIHFWDELYSKYIRKPFY